MSDKKEKNKAAAALAENSENGLRLKAVVLLSGACLMALEMVGVRILEPHFGSTIYVWGSIIGIFLGALSLGYWLGGIISDRYPNIRVLGFVIFSAAMFTMLIPWIAGPYCYWLEDTSSRFRPLWGGLGLYCIPSLLLGIVSPFAVRLAARQVSDLGRVAGSLYALSTLGSIIGTFLVTFVLVEYIGNKAIVLSVAGMLLLVSVLCLLGNWNKKTAAIVALGAIFLAAGIWRWQDPQWRMDVRMVYTPEIAKKYNVIKPDVFVAGTESVYHHISVIDSYGSNYLGGFDRPARLMKFNNQIESGILLNPDGTLQDGKIQTACGYTRLLHTGVLFTQKAPQRVLIIGCGGGVGPQVFYQDYKDSLERIDVVDIDPVVFAYARKYFFFPAKGANPIIKTHVMDGREFIKRSKEKWDYIILDAYSAGGRIPRHLISLEFFQEVQKKLSPGGIMLANIISALGTDDSGTVSTNADKSRLYKATFKALGSVFGMDKIYTFPRKRKGDEAENIIVVAAPDCPVLTAANIKDRYLKLRGTVIKETAQGEDGLDQIIDRVKTVAPLLTGIPLLTDDFCPTDSMVHD